MFIGKVTGHVVATQKTPSMVGQKLLVVEPYRVDARTRSRLVGTGRTFVVVDSLGAGEGAFVLITQGSSARLTPATQQQPLDAVVIGIVDAVHLGRKAVYEREAKAPTS